jgi:hypothetical protein
MLLEHVRLDRAYVSMAHNAVASLKQDVEIEEGTIAELSMASSVRRHGHALKL